MAKSNPNSPANYAKSMASAYQATYGKVPTPMPGKMAVKNPAKTSGSTRTVLARKLKKQGGIATNFR